ncbi:MAG: hypothetical protein ACOX4K_08315 [Bacillota bacterium]|jgi:hypothetical protein
MKRASSIFLVLVLVLLSVAGCTPTEPPKPKEPAKPAEPTIAKIGLGHVTSIAKSADLTVGDDGTVKPPAAQVDTVFAGVAFDKDGKVLKVSVDTAQTKVAYDKDLQVASDLSIPGKTKVELKEDYGMKKVSTISKEWYEQVAELEKWMVGKTVDEIKSMKVKERDASHPSVPAVPELTSTVTITVQDYLAAVEEAYKSAVEVLEGAVKLGLGSDISTAKSRGYSQADGKETLPQAEVNTTIAVSAFDKDGKVVRTIIDVAQTRVAFDKEGKVTSDKTAEIESKVELGDKYGMRKVSTIEKEWFEQIVELEKWMEGKTVEEIKAMKAKERDASHPSVPDVPELTSTVTITVQDYIAAVAKSFGNAK